MPAIAQPPVWAARFLGIPFVDMGRDENGCDCWGLVRLVMRDRAGIALMAYETVSEADYGAVTSEIEQAKAGPEWTAVASGEQRALDVVEMSMPVKHDRTISFLPLHVGVLISHFWMLHTETATGSRLSLISDSHIRPRILGYWRHRSLQ